MRCRRITILEAYLDAYIEAAGIRDARQGLPSSVPRPVGRAR